MNYLYVYLGEYPPYMLTSMNSVLSVEPEANIIFCSDKNTKISGIENINLKKIESKLTKKVKEIDYFKYEKNPLWSTSLLRIFYLLDAAKFLKINNFVHFDTDVMVYKPVKSLNSFFDNKKFNITSLNELDLIFSYSFTKNLECYEEICEKVLNILANPVFYEKKYYDEKKLNEMMLLNIVYIENKHLFNILPSIPTNKNNNNIIFDSITYGQYISGVHNTFFSKKIIEENSYVGRFILREAPEIKFKKIPFIKYKNEIYDLANLHIHSKKLDDYLPENYECFIN